MACIRVHILNCTRARTGSQCSCSRSGCSTAARLDAATAVAKAAAAKAAWYNQRRAYRQLRHRKCADFWRSKLEAYSSNPRQLWRLVDDRLGRSRVCT